MEFIKERIMENKKLFTEEELKKCLDNLNTVFKVYELGCLDAVYAKNR